MEIEVQKKKIQTIEDEQTVNKSDLLKVGEKLEEKQRLIDGKQKSIDELKKKQEEHKEELEKTQDELKKVKYDHNKALKEKDF